MAPQLSDSQVTILSRAFVVLLVVFVLLGAFFQLQTGDPFAILEVVVSLYVVSLVALAVFRGGFDTRRFRIALYVGVVAWALVNYVGGTQSIVTILLLVLGSLLLTRELTFGGD
jgi:glucan phosphoethanolaminetransferase (alkaline phosphatase superfamily)